MPPTGRVTRLQEQCRLFMAYVPTVKQLLQEKHNFTFYDERLRHNDNRLTILHMSDKCGAYSPQGSARMFLRQLSFVPNHDDIQTFLNEVSAFSAHSGRAFSLVGIFVTAMVNILLRQQGCQNPTIELVLPGVAPVNVPMHYTPRYDPNIEYRTVQKEEQLWDHYRDHLLLSNLAYYHPFGTVIFYGNAGGFFARAALKGRVILNGECGYLSCADLRGARVEINGIAGHGFLYYHFSSFIKLQYKGSAHINRDTGNGEQVEGQLRSLCLPKEQKNIKCYLNGKRVYMSEDFNWGYSFQPPEKTQ